MESVYSSLITRKHRFVIWASLMCSLLLLPDKAPAIAALEDYFIFQLNDKKGVRNSKDKVVIPAEYDDLGWSIGEFHPIDDVLGFKDDGLWGLITLKNKKITTPSYVNLYPLNRQLIVASVFNELIQEERYGIIDLEGNVVLSFEYGRLSIFNNLIVASLKKNSEWMYGMLNLSYQQVLGYEYTNIKPLNNQYAIISNGELHGLVNASGQIIAPPKYHVIELNGKEFKGKVFDTYEIRDDQNQLLASHQLKSLRKGEKGVFIGSATNHNQLINTTGQLIKSFANSKLYDFSNGKAVIKENGLYGVINAKGEILIPTSNKNVWVSQEFIAVESEVNKWRLFTSSLEEITTREYQEIKPAKQGLFAFRRQNSWGFLDASGKEVIPPQYQEISDFENNAATAYYLGSWGLINKEGNWLIKPRFTKLEKITDQVYLFESETHFGLANTNKEIVYQSNNPLIACETGVIEKGPEYLFGLTSLEGEQMLSVQYKKISVFKEDPNYYQFEDENGKGIFNISERKFSRDPSIQEMRTLDNGYIGVRINHQYGFVDLNGKLRIANRYEDVGTFSEDMTSVKIKGKWGYVNRLERLKVQPIYESADLFINDLAIVSQKEKFGLIDKSGKIVLELDYDGINRLSEGLFVCHQSEKVGLVNSVGKVLLFPEYGSLEALENGFLKISKNGKHGLINKQGKILIPAKYDDLIYDQSNDLYLLTKKYSWDLIKL